MRSFDDDQGGHWQAALMQASFGNALLIFSRIGSDTVLQTSLDSAATFDEAEQQLARADPAALRGLLSRAKPWREVMR